MLRVAVTGPESTGKSSLAEWLGKTFKAPWVREYSREYLEPRGGRYGVDDLTAIARGQLALEAEAAAGNSPIMFCDTELTVIKIWSEHKYDRVAPEIIEAHRQTTYDLYLLCYPDLPWQPDPLRENPEGGLYFFDLFERALRDKNVAIIKGVGDERTRCARQAVERLLATSQAS